MSTMRIALFGAVALLQIGVAGSMVWQHATTLTAGRVWKFRTAPVDPVDAFRGRYVALRFAAEEFRREQPQGFDRKVYLRLNEDADGFAEVDQATTEPAAGDDVVTAEADGSSGRVRFPFDRFWMGEHLAPEAEHAYREHSIRAAGDAYVTVRVRRGHAALEQLYLGGEPAAEFLLSVRASR